MAKKKEDLIEEAEKLGIDTEGLTVAELEEAIKMADANRQPKTKLVKVKFIKSPSCEPFYLPFYVGDEKELAKEVAESLIAAEFAVAIIE